MLLQNEQINREMKIIFPGRPCLFSDYTVNTTNKPLNSPLTRDNTNYSHNQ